MQGEIFYIIVDESTYTYGRYIIHLMIGALKELEPYLIASNPRCSTISIRIIFNFYQMQFHQRSS